MLEEYVVEKLLEDVDPENRARAYWEAAEEYLRQAEEELKRGDSRQASEKLWGAAALAVKALAYERDDGRLSSRRELWEYIDKLIEETGDEELGGLWRTATSMHINFYEDWAPPREVGRSLKKVKQLVEKLKRIAAKK